MSKRHRNAERNRNKALQRQRDVETQIETHNTNVKLEITRALVNKQVVGGLDIGDKTKKIPWQKMHFTLVEDEEGGVILTSSGQPAEMRKYYYPSLLVEAPLHPARFKIHTQYKLPDKEKHRDMVAMEQIVMHKAAEYPNIAVRLRGQISYPFFRKGGR